MVESTVTLTQRQVVRAMTAIERYANYARDEAARCAAVDYEQGVMLWQTVQREAMEVYEKLVSSS